MKYTNVVLHAYAPRANTENIAYSSIIQPHSCHSHSPKTPIRIVSATLQTSVWVCLSLPEASWFLSLSALGPALRVPSLYQSQHALCPWAWAPCPKPQGTCALSVFLGLRNSRPSSWLCWHAPCTLEPWFWPVLCRGRRWSCRRLPDYTYVCMRTYRCAYVWVYVWLNGGTVHVLHAHLLFVSHGMHVCVHGWMSE